jgi:PAS domain S-box-containing protein
MGILRDIGFGMTFKSERIFQGRRMNKSRYKNPNRIRSSKKGLGATFAADYAVGLGLILLLRHLAGGISDITKSSEETSFWSKKKYRALVEHSSDIISLMDAQGFILYKSPSITRVLGFGGKELIGRHSLEVAHPDDHNYLKQLFFDLLQSPPDKVLIGEFRHLHKDGSYRWMEGTACNMLSDPTVHAIVFSYRDITPRKEAQTALVQAQANLEHYADELEQRVAQRTGRLEESLRSLEGVLYHVAHDLRAPLRAIHGYTSQLLEYCPPDLHPQTTECSDKIFSAARRMDELIRGLLEYGRLGHVELPSENLSLETEIATVLGHLANEIKCTKAEISVAEPLPQVRAHAQTLQQLLHNFIENALKFVPSGVVPRVRIWAELLDDKVMISVQDNGIGVAPEFQDKIFRVFERLQSDTTYPGTGIGLAITRKAAERMGGSVGVESSPGHGSRFWVALPAAKKEG